MPLQSLRRHLIKAVFVSSSDSDSETDDSSQVAKPIQRLRSQRYNSLPVEKASSTKFAVAPNTTNRNSQYSRTIHSNSNAGKPVQTSNAAENKDKKISGDDERPVSPRASRKDKILPAGLIQIWKEIDQALPPDEIQEVYQTTFAQFRPATPLAAQPWMQTDNKSGIVALEKARITNGGKIPASWKTTAEQSEHGRKWLKVGREQEQAKALARARENMEKTAADEISAKNKVVTLAAQYNEINRKAQNALEDSKSAATRAKIASEWAMTTAEWATQTKEAAEKVCEEADKARIAFNDSRVARDEASLVASSAVARVKKLEEEARKATEDVPPSKKRKLESSNA